MHRINCDYLVKVTTLKVYSHNLCRQSQSAADLQTDPKEGAQAALLIAVSSNQGQMPNSTNSFGRFF